MIVIKKSEKELHITGWRLAVWEKETGGRRHNNCDDLSNFENGPGRSPKMKNNLQDFNGHAHEPDYLL